ncbi:MAG: hypothetical protein ACQPRH_05370 [Solitalea-like symbiont of Tyrophagus putrescentiae]
MVQIMMNVVVTHGQSPKLPEGVIMSIDASNGDKGLVLPKVELTDLSQYSPIQGKPIDGLVVHNIHLDASKGLVRGIYIWNVVWDRILDYNDMPGLLDRIRVYTGTQDPNQSSSPEITDAPSGSLYINTSTKIIFKKITISEDKPDIWIKDLSMAPVKYTGSTSIAVNPVMETNKIEAIVGSGLEITDKGIVASIDTTKMSINQNLISAKNSEPLWNATKLQSSELDIRTPVDGHILRYNGSKWLNIPERIYTGISGIDVAGSTISALIDTKTLQIKKNQIGAKNNEILWNANQLKGTPLNVHNPEKGHIIKYDGEKWINALEYSFINGGVGIDIIGDAINAALSTNTLIIKNNQISARNEDALWNSNKLKDIELVETGIPTKGQVLRYSDGKWTNTIEYKLIGSKGINITDDTISTLIDTTTLSITNNNEIKVKNEDALWNADKLQGITINKTIPLQGQTLRYNATNKEWIPKQVNETPNGTKLGDILTWSGSEWVAPPKDGPVQQVIINSQEIYLPDLATFKDKDDGDNKKDYFLTLAYDHKMNASPISPWNMYGNKGTNVNLRVGDITDYIVGLNSKTSPANLLIKTNNKEIISIESTGKIAFKDGPNVYFTSYNGEDVVNEQLKSDSLLMIDESGKVKLSSDIGWTSDGYNRSDQSLGVLGLISKNGNLVMKVANKDRIRMHSNGDITVKSDSLYIEGLASRAQDTNPLDFPLLVDSTGQLFKWRSTINSIISNTDSKILKSGVSSLGFTDPINKADIVFSTQNTERLRISSTGGIQMALEPSDVSPYDLVVINRTSSELSKTSLKSLLADSGKSYNSSSGSSQTQVISISDITKTPSSLANLGIDIAGPYGNTMIHIIYADNKPEAAKVRYGTTLLKVGHDNTGKTFTMLTHAYDMTNNNKNLLSANNNNIRNVNVGGLEVSFNLEKQGDTYKLIPNINKGSNTTGYLILRSKQSKVN